MISSFHLSIHTGEKFRFTTSKWGNLPPDVPIGGSKHVPIGNNVEISCSTNEPKAVVTLHVRLKNGGNGKFIQGSVMFADRLQRKEVEFDIHFILNFFFFHDCSPSVASPDLMKIVNNDSA